MATTGVKERKLAAAKLISQAKRIRRENPGLTWSATVALISLELGKEHNQEVAFEAALAVCRDIPFRFIPTPPGTFRKHSDEVSSSGYWNAPHGGSE